MAVLNELGGRPDGVEQGSPSEGEGSVQLTSLH